MTRRDLADILAERISKPYRELVRHFFQGFFDAEIVHPTAEARLTVGHILAVLAVPGLLISFYLHPNYVQLSMLIWLERLPEIAYQRQIWADKCFFEFFAASLTAFVTVFQWDSLFLGRRDWVVLGAMPLRTRTILGAKLTALAMFLVLFALDLNLIASVIFPVSAMRKADPPGHGIAFLASHMAAIFMTCLFVFLFLIALQGLLMNLLPARVFRRVSPAAQLILMIGSLMALLVFPKVASLLQPQAAEHPLALYLLPPMWFLGWSEVKRGRAEPVFQDLGAIALPALAAVAAVAAASYLISYYRHVRRSLEQAAEIDTAPSWWERAAWRLADRVLVRNSVEQAIFAFTIKTALRSRRHWLILGAYAGVGLSIVLNATLIVLTRAGYAGFQQPTTAVLAVPLVLTVLLLAGLRFVFTIPAELRANWVFRITETGDSVPYLTGVRKAMLALAAVLILLPLFPVHTGLWDWTTSLHHLAFGFAMAWAIIEAFLFRFHKIPFACSYLPGKANVPFHGALYVAGFLTFVTAAAGMELWLLRGTWRFAAFAVLASVGLVWLHLYRNRLAREADGLVYDEEPDSITLLNLSS